MCDCDKEISCGSLAAGISGLCSAGKALCLSLHALCKAFGLAKSCRREGRNQRGVQFGWAGGDEVGGQLAGGGGRLKAIAALTCQPYKAVVLWGRADHQGAVWGKSAQACPTGL